MNIEKRMINLRYNRIHLILFSVLIGFAALGLWIRLLPMDYLLGMSQPVVLYEDPWYTVRQVEQILPNFPGYSWFDPMLSFPYGKVVDWGPVFPLFASLFAIISGATTQGEIIRAINWAPVLLGLLLIPLSFFIGRLIWDSWAGWISAMLICVVGGETLFRSFYGYVDHHVMEVVLTAGFFICYFYLLSHFSTGKKEKSIKSRNEAVNDTSIHKKEMDFCARNVSLIALCTGLLYYLAIMTMPTCTIIAITVGIITFLLPIMIQEKDQIFRLLQINGIIFGLFIVLFLISGIHVSGLSFSQYTAVHLVIPTFILIESCILYLVSWRFKNPKPRVFMGFIAAFIAIFSLIIFQFIPDIANSMNNVFFGFFWGAGSGYLIQEMNSADLGQIIRVFNITAILAVFGLILFALRLIKERNPVHLAAFVWIIVYVGISLMVVRYFYYGGHILVILAGICVSDVYRRMQTPSNKKAHINIDNSVVALISANKRALAVTCLFFVTITLLSVPVSIFVSSPDNPAKSVSEEWLESLQWLKKSSNSPEEMYYSQFSKQHFEYPDTMFTVLSWWDYGNWILAIAHLSPATNPFQTNIDSVARYLLSDNHVDAEATADWLHVKYVITTNDYLFDSFSQIRKWLPEVTTDDPYYFYFYQQDPRNKLMFSPMLGMKPAFFNTTLVKLHVNDGSLALANGSVSVQYERGLVGGQEVSLLQKMYPIDQVQTEMMLSQSRINQEIISLQYTSPVTDTPALQNYRLIYESNGTESFPGDVTLNNIKIFERVKGYTIPGTGTIEVPIVTNQGRHFTYRQQSVNGTFTLPYATTNSPYDVRATAPYRIIETKKTFDVDESQIEKYYT